MQNNLKIIVVLPAFNEQDSIGILIKRICFYFENYLKMNFKIILVDDGSKDRTIDVASKSCSPENIILVKHKLNMGLGSTIRDGLRKAVEISDESDIIITLDADNTHTPALFSKMIYHIEEGHDIVIASRFRPASRVIGVPFMRKVYSYIAFLLFKTVMPISGVRDYTCGFRSYRPSILKKGFEFYGDKFFDQAGFQSMVDILLKLKKFNPIIFEIPFILRYDLKGGVSKMRVGNTIVKSLALLLRRRFNY